jgi:hypothetical protein
MPSQPASGHPPSVAHLVRLAFPHGEWNLLTRLPRQVMIAATSAEPDSPRRTVAEGLSGLDAIAAGRRSDSDLVRAVVAAIYAGTEQRHGQHPDPGQRRLDQPDARTEPRRADDEDLPVAEEFRDRAAGLADTLDACRRATDLLAIRADPADSAAYRQWVESIAVRVCDAARSGGVLGFGGDLRSAAEEAFLADLAEALGLR